MASTDNIALLILAWTLYAILHSLLASLTVKRAIHRLNPRFTPFYRIGFNLLATILLIPPIWLTYQGDSPMLWQWLGIGFWLTTLTALAAIALFIFSLRFYDSSEFFGFRQAREKRSDIEDQETFRISPLHRIVRHPWYSLGLVLIWTRDMNAELLTSAICITLYFVIGSKIEEKKLCLYHGNAYHRYKSKVPGLVPLPWRILSQDEAKALEQEGRRQSTR